MPVWRPRLFCVRGSRKANVLPKLDDIIQWAILLFGASGLLGWYRARIQNRVEDRNSLTEEQQKFREAMREEIRDLHARNRFLAERLDAADAREVENARTNAELKARLEYQDQRAVMQDIRIENLADMLTLERKHRDQQDREIMQLREENTRCKEMIVKQDEALANQKHMIAELQALRETSGLAENTEKVVENTAAIERNTAAVEGQGDA